MSKETLFEIDINELDNPFEREKLEMLPKEWLIELLVRHLKKEIKAIEYIKKDNFVDYIPNTKNYLRLMKIRCDLLKILGDKE